MDTPISKKKGADGRNAIDQFSDALAAAKIKILKFDSSKQRPVSTGNATMNIEKFSKEFLEKLGPDAVSYPIVFKALHNLNDAAELIDAYAKMKGIAVHSDRREIDSPADMEGLTLNFDLTAQGRDNKFFLTDSNELVSRISGEAYLLAHQLSAKDAVSVARRVIPEYQPRGQHGVFTKATKERDETIFNTYTRPSWSRLPERQWEKLPDKLPSPFSKLVNHLFPIKEEREFFFAWLHDSMFKRSYIFLILCGAPGTGKNRLKLVLRALHGHANTIDGKKSTLTERFNSQLSESTLAWFDELRFDLEMENTMKELQNDSISIERKGVDATRATKIHASIVISNNKPRDNYIAFEARKFAPLKVTEKRLENSMSSAEIKLLTEKVEDENSNTFDVQFIAQIAKWVQKHGASDKWPNLEYRGPMFWTLAHTSMSQWQKSAIAFLINPSSRTDRHGWSQDKQAFLWSSSQSGALRKGNDRYLKFPDFTTVHSFIESFRDSKGQKAFSTKPVAGVNILGDFWIHPIFEETKVVTETALAKQKEGKSEKVQKEFLDL